MTAHPKPARPVRSEQYKNAVRALPCLGFTLDVDHVCRGWDGQMVDACHLGPHHSHLRADDNTTVPMDHFLHLQMHALKGPFRGWTKAEIRAWSAWAIKDTREQVTRLMEDEAA